jgi:iron-sulfur cluster assembly protein
MSVTLTEKAATEVKRILEEQKLPEDTILRVGIRGGGCSGFEYSLGFDKTVDELNDEVADCHGIKVAVDRKSLLYLEGTAVDYYDGLEKRGFVFNNPNATRSCGCGSSFSV